MPRQGFPLVHPGHYNTYSPYLTYSLQGPYLPYTPNQRFSPYSRYPCHCKIKVVIVDTALPLEPLLQVLH